MNTFNHINGKYTILDGAIGTILQSLGLKLGERPEILGITHPEVITKIHRDYVESGSDIVYANTFGANSKKLAGFNYTAEEVIFASISAARSACIGTNAKVALDIGPTGELIEPMGSATFDEVYETFKEMCILGERAGADLIVFETMTDLYEVKAAVLAAKENTSLPIFVSMTFEENRRTFTGCTVKAMSATLEGLGVDAIGINCSLGPKEILPIAKELCENTSLPVFVKPNAGLPNPEDGSYSIDAAQFVEDMKAYSEIGISMVGGCCGTSPAFIHGLSEYFGKLPLENHVCPGNQKSTPSCPCTVCSSTKTLVLDHLIPIGEAINPTGRKLVKKALLENDMDYILSLVVSQAKAGAEIINVNAALPELDEVKTMCQLVKSIQRITDLPLQIDSVNPAVIEAALRIYNGKCILNSINGDRAVMEKILPIVKKYGAAVIGLTLDEEGIPTTAEGRVSIAKKILDTAISYGIPKSNVIIDCLTLTASAEQEGAMATIKAIEMVTQNLELHTLLGVSNISFGLPRREVINRTFLALAMNAGLDMLLMNVENTDMMDTVFAFQVLSTRDLGSVKYIERFAPSRNSASPHPSKPASPSGDLTQEYTAKDIQISIENGLKSDTIKIAQSLLLKMDENTLISEVLIPALDSLGEKFETGELFLPQLVQGAQVAQEVFELIKERLSALGQSTESQGKIILATVEGDIHDIGKNIVKIILENYGYEIIDLGRDVPVNTVVEAVREHNVDLVGLSALMTTTVVSMQETIKAIRDANLNCKIMVGGAVLTPEYATKIGADFYASDAKQSADIARLVYGNR